MVNNFLTSQLQVDERADLKKLRSILESSTWGAVFGEDGQLMNTLFSSLLEEYVSLVIPDLGYLTGTVLGPAHETG